MREDQKLSDQYKKNQRFEKVITSLNQQLEKSQPDLLENLEEIYPTIHILGAPRSGTTLVSQLVPSYLEVAHINNFIAAFWKAPLYGIELSKKLIGETYKSSFSSDFGRTNNINEPHEFGYFWNYHLKYDGLYQKPETHEKEIDWNQLALLLKNMTAAFGKPIIFKSFLLGFHAKAFYNKLPKSKFIYIKRNLVDNVLSILKLRKQLNGDIDTWGSIKPIQYEQLKELNVYEQVVGQIVCLEHEYLNQLESISESNKLIYSYESLCERPNSFLETINFKLLDKEIQLNDIAPFEVHKRKIDIDEEQKILNASEKIKKLFPNLKSI
ncbi:MAG: sulfotransferase [Bacteroidota bacterium]